MKLLIGGVLLICVLVWFFIIAFQKPTVTSDNLKQEVEALESFVSAGAFLAKNTEENNTTPAYVASQGEDMENQVMQIKQTLQQKTPDASIQTTYNKVLIIATEDLTQLHMLSSFSGNRYVAKRIEKSFQEQLKALTLIDNSL